MAPKILHVCESSEGGGEAYFRNFLDYSEDFGLVEISNRNRNLSRYSARHFSLERGKGPLARCLAFFRFLSLVAREKPSALHANDSRSLLFCLALSCIPLIHKPGKFFCTKHDPKAKAYLIYDFLQQMYIDRCSAVFCISKTTKSSMEKYHHGNFVMIYNGFRFGKACAHPRKMKKQVFFFGRMVHKKGVDLLVQAYSRLRHNACHRLLLAGQDGSGYLKQLPAMPKNAVYLGHISDKEKKRLLCESEAVVIPSRAEGFGYAALEALYLRDRPKTLLLSDIGAFKEIAAGFPTYFESGSSKDLESKLDHILGNPRGFPCESRHRGMLARRFSSGQMMKQYMGHYL